SRARGEPILRIPTRLYLAGVPAKWKPAMRSKRVEAEAAGARIASVARTERDRTIRAVFQTLGSKPQAMCRAARVGGRRGVGVSGHVRSARSAHADRGHAGDRARAGPNGRGPKKGDAHDCR